MDRRDFLKHSVAGAAALGGGLVSSFGRAQEVPAKEAVLKLCSQESKIPAASLRDKILKLEGWGGVGVEIGGCPTERIKEIKDALAGTKVRVSALCWGSHNGDLVSMDMDKRAKGIADVKQALTVAGELEALGVIFVPCFHKQSDLKPEELEPILMDILPGIGEHAVACKTHLLLEPLNRMETFYIKTLEQAAAICNKVNHPGICMMGDFYHMGIEETDDRQAFVTGGKWVHHVHLASKKRNLPGQDERSFVEGFKGLKQIGYQDYCSLECGILKDTDPEVEIPKSFRFLEQQWKEAVV